jgi:hypothetical protein
MEFLKKYSALILPIALALVAVLLFIPRELISSAVSENLEKSARLSSNIDSLFRKAVPQRQWEIEAEYQAKYEQDVNTVALLLKQTTQRELLSYSIFPEPKSSSNQIFKNFGQKYVEAIDNLANKVMNAGDAPSDKVLSSLTGGVRTTTGRQTTRTSDGLSDTDSSAERIIDTACTDKANQIAVYANPEDSFVGYNFWKDYSFVSKDQGVEDCWYAQISYWIQEDVAETIRQINANSDKVFTSKVKRLIGVRFNSSEVEISIGDSGSRGTGSEQIPSYVLKDDIAGLAPAWTGRKCSDDLDVVHFSLAVVIDARAVPEFYNYLCGQKEHKFTGWDGGSQEQQFVRNQITILQESITPIDLKSAEHKNYRYGTAAVVKLNLVCEYIFQRTAYDEIKPELIKKELSQSDAANQ